MTESDPRYVPPVSSTPEKALSQTVLDELNRMNDRIRTLEKQNDALAERVYLLWGALSALGKPPQ